MINGNFFFDSKMKRAFYFLWGFSISVFLGFSPAYCCDDMTSFENYIPVIYSNYEHISIDYFDNQASAEAALSSFSASGYSVRFSNLARSYSGVNYCILGSRATGFYDSRHTVFVYAYGVDPCSPDSDGDGLPDDCDFYPNDSKSYSVKMTGYQTTDGTSTGDKTYICYITDRGDQLCTGTDGILAGADEYVVADGTWIDGKDLCSDGLPGPVFDAPPTVVKHPNAPNAPSTPSSDGDSDSDSFKKIADNTDSTNKNLENIADYLGITNDLLGKINNKSGSSGGLLVGMNTPTADEIGQSVKDKLIDSGQTIDTTITDNIPDLDKTDTITAIKTKYSDRYDLFITTLKESDLFSLPFEIFAGPSGSGSSTQTVNIGKWGSSNEQTATIDYSDYDNIWEILRSVLLLLTSFACFKILVLKKG